jgi:uncharacterized protein YegP (UPF0339 family)
MDEAHFEVYKDRKKKLRFRLRAENGEIVCTSQAYKTKNGLLDGVRAIRSLAPSAKMENYTRFKIDLAAEMLHLKRTLKEVAKIG